MASHCDGTQHLLRLDLRLAEGTDGRPCDLETQSCPCTGLLMTGDVTMGASVVSRLGEGAAANGAAQCSEARVSVSSSAGAAGRGVDDHGSARGARRHDRHGLSPAWLHLDVWFVPPSPRYAARNLSIENVVWRASMWYTARPILCARIDSAFPLPWRRSRRALSRWPSRF